MHVQKPKGWEYTEHLGTYVDLGCNLVITLNVHGSSMHAVLLYDHCMHLVQYSISLSMDVLGSMIQYGQIHVV